MRIFHDNKIFSAELTASSENLNLPVENLQKFQTIAKFRTVVKSNQWVKIAGNITANSFWILNHNLTSSAVVKVQGSNYSDFSYIEFEEQAVIDERIYIDFDEKTFNFWRVTIDDPTNSNNYLELGYIFIGCFEQLPAMKPDQQFTVNTTADYQTGSANVSYSKKGVQFRTNKINLVNLTFDQKKSVKSMFDNVGNYQPVIMVVWENDLEKEEPCYCILDGKKLTFKTSNIYNRKFDVSFKFREVL